MKNNLITIIVATFNADSCLENLIESIISQDANYEFILIDGGSKDKTIEIIKKYQSYINYWISESDKGIYDAWNKGIAKATGDWIMFLGADDYLKSNALKKYYNFLNVHPRIEDLLFLSSKREMIDLKGNLIRTTGYSWEWPLFKKFMTVSHPGALHSSRLFEKYGMYNIDYKISGDYELLLRPRENLNAAFMADVTVIMSEGGTSDSIKAITEYFKATTQTGGSSKASASINAIIVVLKFIVKKSLRKIGLNVYLKR
ncbi:glycosyltransferase family 2 protein [Pedobacter sp. AJM]|uniref:glycosyltransferase family 2 protein n=1 Tax=Pedobacter sp. AJM TaxID=2003629 RepID=UPI000B4A6539|nr:glycosyltransferase family 2 protein [Pedobacter sp. AJM]OWK71248.1 glycosyl transferase [Pedobacter sp. AJM]